MPRLKDLLRWVLFTNANDNADGYPVQQVTYLGKMADTVVAMPYGFFANVPNDTLGVSLSIQGNADNRATIPLDVKNWPQLQAGEVSIYNPVDGLAKVTLKEGGLVQINDTVTIDALGNITATSFNSGTMTSGEGTTAFTGTVTANGKNIGDTHGHTQGNDSAGDTQQPISGVV